MQTNKKILLVTGASSDIACALIHRVAGNYDTVIAHYRSSEDKILELRQQHGEKIIPLQADFSDERQTTDFAGTILSKELSPTHFVHMPAPPASVQSIKFPKTSWETFDIQISTSFRSAVILCQSFLPDMAKQKYGKIIFMLSYNTVCRPIKKYAAPYTSVKYALLGLMNCLSAEYADKGITVNGVSPSMVETRFLSGLPELVVQKNARESPLGRNLSPNDVIPAFEFLLSDGADCVTGQNLAVTGGN